MSHIPRAVCLTCNREMKTERQGVMAEALASFGSYYKIQADRLECELCGNQMLVGWAQRPMAEHFEPDYESLEVDHTFVFQGERYGADVAEAGIEAVHGAIQTTEERLRILRSKLSYAHDMVDRREKEAAP